MDIRDIIEKAKIERELEYISKQQRFELLIDIIPHNKQKMMVGIGKKTIDIIKRLEDIGFRYAKLSDPEIFEDEVKEVLEYLQLVECGIVEFMKQKEKSR